MLVVVLKDKKLWPNFEGPSEVKSSLAHLCALSEGAHPLLCLLDMYCVLEFCGL